MKKALILSLAFLCSSGMLFSQGELDAYKMSQRDLKGTARSVAMGGAFGALGGDISGVAINPAGIGVYTSSEIVTTINFKNSTHKSTMTGISHDKNKFSFAFDNFGLVHSMPLYSDVVPRLNIGFSYNRVKSFDRKVRMEGQELPGSLTDHMARRATKTGAHLGLGDGNAGLWNKYDWMGIIGYNSYLINKDGNTNNYYSPMHGLSVNNALNYKEKGYINNYDFNIGTTIADILSLGLTVSVTDMQYKLSSAYDEFLYDEQQNKGDYYIDNKLETEGSGWQVAIGAILKPIDELRIGVAYHSPTWYNMTDYFDVQANSDLRGLLNSSDATISPEYTFIESPLGRASRHDYKFQTPGYWTFSLASVIASKAIISIDYELTDYTQMKLKNRYSNDFNNRYNNDNYWIKEDFKLASSLRAGVEYRFTPQFSGRIGYAWTQSPYEKEFGKNHREAGTRGTVSHFTLDGDIHSITWGLGYRFSKNFYTDIAFVYQQQKDGLYAYSNVYPDPNNENSWDIESAPGTLKTTSFQGLLSFGFKF